MTRTTFFHRNPTQRAFRPRLPLEIRILPATASSSRNRSRRKENKRQTTDAYSEGSALEPSDNHNHNFSGMLKLNHKNKKQQAAVISEQTISFSAGKWSRGEDNDVDKKEDVAVMKTRVHDILAPFDEDAIDQEGGNNPNDAKRNPQKPVAILSCGERFELLPTTTQNNAPAPQHRDDEPGSKSMSIQTIEDGILLVEPKKTQKQRRSDEDNDDSADGSKTNDNPTASSQSRAPPGLSTTTAKTLEPHSFRSTPLYKRVIETKFRKAAVIAASTTVGKKKNGSSLSSSSSPPPPLSAPTNSLRQRLAAAGKKIQSKNSNLKNSSSSPGAKATAVTVHAPSFSKPKKLPKKKKRLVAGKRIDFFHTPSKAPRLASVKESDEEENTSLEGGHKHKHANKNDDDRSDSPRSRHVSFGKHVGYVIYDADTNSILEEEKVVDPAHYEYDSDSDSESDTTFIRVDLPEHGATTRTVNVSKSQLDSEAEEEKQQDDPWDPFQWNHKKNTATLAHPNEPTAAFFPGAVVQEWFGGSNSSVSSMASDSASMTPLAPNNRDPSNHDNSPLDIVSGAVKEWFAAATAVTQPTNPTTAADTSSITAVAPVF